ncbi:MAG: gas vesicle protein GvpN [Desulfobacterales bacterium]|nr:gas vesicle protein GvpN [Pseudomonadota bacterium]MCG2776882.1 gas vesicle protein GvpN [Desulfobacterales bacterium]
MYSENVSEVTPIIIDKDQPGFVRSDYVEGIMRRAMTYMRAGLPIHLSGSAGTGKTTIAMYLAAQIGRPVMLVHGDDEFGTSDLIGGQYGYSRKKMVDNFIQSVLKSEEKVAPEWIDNRITVACKYGFTLIYDEFTRSRPEANNVLLAILEEKILDLPAGRGENGYLRVSPDFRAIFTSNPEEYAGVHKAQDALKDRMITIKLGHYDRETESSIVEAKSGIPRDEAVRVVDIIRAFRKNSENNNQLSIRASIIIGKILNETSMRVDCDNSEFVEACMDVIDFDSNGFKSRPEGEIRRLIMDTIKGYC